MLELLQNILTNEIKVLLTAAMPVFELKAALPLGIALGMKPWHAFITSFLGSILPVPLLFLLIRPLFKRFKTLAALRDFIEKFEHRTIRKSKNIQKYGAWGLFFFVAIPLPGTGVWTGTLGAVLLDIRFKWAFPAILIGNMVAGLIIMTVSLGAFSVFTG